MMWGKVVNEVWDACVILLRIVRIVACARVSFSGAKKANMKRKTAGSSLSPALTRFFALLFFSPFSSLPWSVEQATALGNMRDHDRSLPELILMMSPVP